MACPQLELWTCWNICCDNKAWVAEKERSNLVIVHMDPI